MSRQDEIVAIVREHSAFVWRSLRFQGVADRDLDDVGQEVFIVALRKLDDFEGRSSLRGWLYGICVKCAAAHRRRAHQRYEDLDQEPAELLAGDDPERSLAAQRSLDLLQRALAELRPEQRDVFILYEIEQLTMPQVADLLSCKLQTAYSRYKAAKEQVTTFVRRETRDD